MTTPDPAGSGGAVADQGHQPYPDQGHQPYPPAPVHPIGGMPPPPGHGATPPPPGPDVTPPPPGPGVTPPFPAPPVEGRSTRLWLGLGVAGLVALLCCGGGTAAVIGLVITGTRAINEQATAAVDNYLDDLRAGRFDEAYQALCPRLRQRETARQFTARLSDEPRITDYQVHDVELGTDIVVPVTVWNTTGASSNVRVKVEQDTSSGELEVCGLDE